jgi:small-conductance mechanosensitive channel
VGFDLATRNLLPLNLAAGLVGVYWLRRPERVHHIPVRLGRGLWFRLLGGWLRLAGVAFAVGLIAAILGYTNLADRIAFVAIWGSVFGAGYLAVVLTAEAVLEAIVDAGWLDLLRMVRAQRRRFVEVVRRGVRLLGLFVWLYQILDAAQIWDPLWEGLGTLLGARLGYGPVTFSIGSVLAFGVTLYVSWQLARFLSFTLDQEVFSRVRMPPGVPFALTTFTRYAVLVGGFVAAVSILGFSWDRLSLLIGALGVGIGFGLQNVVNNFVSGVILLFERPVRVGDRVQLDDLIGVVSTIGIRASRVRTFDGSDVMVPNGDFISARVINWTLSDQRRRVILPVGVAYGTKPARVLEILEQVAQRNPDVLAEPAPEALFRAFGPSSLDFELRAWTESERGYLSVLSDLAVATEEALETAGIQIPLPQRDLHLRNIPELSEAMQDAMRASRPSGSDESLS